MIFFLPGLLLGFSIAAPVRPIGVLCIRRSGVAGSFSRALSAAGLRWVNRVSGAIIAGFGALALLAVR